MKLVKAYETPEISVEMNELDLGYEIKTKEPKVPTNSILVDDYKTASTIFDYKIDQLKKGIQ